MDYGQYAIEGQALNYLAVAKVGVLVYADWVFDTYINDGRWKIEAWNGNVVHAIFSGGSQAIAPSQFY